MNKEDKFVQDVKSLLDTAIERGKEMEKANPASAMSEEQISNELKRMDQQVELTRNRAENITSRFHAGIISADVAKKQMRNVLMEECTQLIADMVRFGNVASDTTVTIDQIKEAMRKVNIDLS